MAKRVPVDEKPYRPVDEALVRSVLAPEAVKEEDQGREAGHPYDEKKGQDSADRVSAPSVEKLTREKRVLLTASEERDIERLVDRMAEALDAPVKLSHLLRACMAILRHAEGELAARAEKEGPLRRPSNGDAVALAQFEHRLARIVSMALRQAPPLR